MYKLGFCKSYNINCKLSLDQVTLFTKGCLVWSKVRADEGTKEANLKKSNMLAASKCTILKQFFITCNILIAYTYITKFCININFQRFNIWFMHFYRTIKVINKRNISGSIFKKSPVKWNLTGHCHKSSKILFGNGLAGLMHLVL